MNFTNEQVSKRPTLPVSIPIDIYHKTLEKASANSGSKNISKQEMTKPIEHIKHKENTKHMESTSKRNDQRENQPKQTTMVNKNKQSADKSTFTDPPLMTNQSPEVNTFTGQNNALSSHFCFMLYNNFLNSVIQKHTIYENKSTQTDDVPLSHEDKANNEVSNAKSKDTQANKDANIFKEVEYFSQEYRNFYIELNTSTKRLFEEIVSNNKRTFKYSQEIRHSFLNITKNIIDLITRGQTENATEDISSGASVDTEIVNKEVENDVRESSENIMPSVVNNNNDNKETSRTKTQRAQNIVQQNDLPEVQEDNPIQKEQLNIEQSYIEEYAPNAQTLQAPPTVTTVTYSNVTPYEHQQRSNVMNSQMHFNNMAFNPQNASRCSRTPRPQILQQQLLSNGGYHYDYQNKMYRYPGKMNVRPIPYHQKLPKRKPFQAQGVETVPPYEHGYYPVNQQQFIQQPITYQQNLQ